MTPGFSPPEQYGTGPTDARTDVYSLAATLYAALSGEIPEDALERAMGRMSLTPLERRNSKISRGISRAIEKALSISPDERYQSVTQFASALSAASSSGMTTVSRSLPHLVPTVRAREYSDTAKLRTKVETTPKPRKRWPFLVALLASAVIITGGIIIGKPAIEASLGGLLSTPTQQTPTNTIQPEKSTQPGSTELAIVPNPTDSVDVSTSETVSLTPTFTMEPTLEPTPASTPIGGGVGQIAFASNREGVPQIFLMNVDSTGLQQLTNLQDGACQPAWSPDGSQLLFISPCNGNREQYPGSSIWLLSLDTLESTQLPTIPGGGDYDPAWDPNGERVAFTSLRDGWPQIYLMNLDGSNLQNISDGYQTDYQPAWDPRGTNLLFSAVRGDVSEIMIMPDTGGNEQQFSMGESQGHTHADWSKDGEFILFERQQGDIPRLVVKRFGERLKVANQVCLEGSRTSQPMAEGKWSPDARWITFETWPNGVEHDIAIISSNCSSYTQLTSDIYPDFDPVWRP
jgi:Tol biopolymer transport system component